MKKVTAVVALLVVYLSWGQIDALFNPSLPLAKFALQAPAQPLKQVILYGTTWCGYCQKTRDFLDENHIAYTEFDIESSTEGRRRYDDLYVSGVPVVQVNNVVIQGYAPQAILEALNTNKTLQTY